MVKVCLMSHGHPAADPRLVREANALCDAGHDVSVVTSRFVEKWVPFDREIVAAAGWRYACVDFLGRHRRRWKLVAARRRLAAALAECLPTESLVSRACNYANPELGRLAAEQKADLFVAHQHHSLPAAAWAARRTGARFGFDAEDLLAESSAEPQRLIRSIERRYLGDCAYISTMSDAAARRLEATNGLRQTVSVLHNTPSLSERSRLVPPDARPSAAVPSLYWFGQTIGAHSCARQVVSALPLLARPVRLVLRGAAQEAFVREIRDLADRLGVASRLEILPLASPKHMVTIAGEHDLLLGTQPGQELFHQMAIGNKVFTGMMAGLALALTDTIAHRDLLASAPGCGFLFPDGDAPALAKRLDAIVGDSRLLIRMKQASWTWAEREFNWERESSRHVALIERVGRGGTA